MKAQLSGTQLQNLQAIFGARVPEDLGQALQILEASPCTPADAIVRAALREQVMALAGQRLDALEAAAGTLGGARPSAHTQRSMPPGVGLRLANMTGGGTVGATDKSAQRELTKAQTDALRALGVAQADLPRVAAGEVVVALLPTGTGDDTIGTVQLADDHIKSAIISIRDEGHGLRSMGDFRGRSFDVARAFGKTELELGGAAVINGKIEALLKRQGFELSTRAVPDDLGNDGQMELYSKRMKVPELTP